MEGSFSIIIEVEVWLTEVPVFIIVLYNRRDSK